MTRAPPGTGVRCCRRSAAGKWFALAALSATCSAWRPQPLAADGAFADSKAILLPLTQPERIIASAEVSGLLISDDSGASWDWICEDAIGTFSALFQLGAAPDERLYAISRHGLVLSSDGGCSWTNPDGIAQQAGDVFPDPSDPAHVLIASQVALADQPGRSDVIVESSDYGETFGPAQFATASASISGVEVSRSEPALRYLTMSSLELQHPYVVRSSDRGQSWRAIDLSRQLGQQMCTLRILAIDPDAARSLYLRLSNGARDALGISRDGGDTVRVALQLEARMSAFLRRSDGALIVASSDGQSWISRDGGDTFAIWPTTLHISALAERAGRVYASTNDKLDGFAIAVSSDGGATWRPLLRLAELRGPRTCGSIAQLCAAPWAKLKSALPMTTTQAATEADASAPPLAASQSMPVASSSPARGCSILATGRSDFRSFTLLMLGVCGLQGLRARRRQRHQSAWYK
jgi:photosystem II stability/assembly factor-like uncharacterized protein